MKSLFFANTFIWPGPKPDASNVYANILTIVFTLLGALSMIVILYAGIRLTASRGNPEAIGKLRSTLLYAAIGLFVSLTAAGILNFVIGSLR